MRIPKKLKIGGHVVTVKIKELEDKDGEFEPSTNTIFLDNKSCKSRQEATLIHEVLHVINAVLGNRDMGHIFLDSLAEQLYQVFSDNKLLK